MPATISLHPARLLIWGLAASAMLATQGLAQTIVTFDTAQQYTNNFNEIADSTADNTPGDYLDWSAPGNVRLTPPSRGAFSPSTYGAALYNPNASTTTTGPTFTTGTFACDFGTTVLITSHQTLGLLADVQPNGQGVAASFSPMLGNSSNYVTAVSIAYGSSNSSGGAVSTSIYSATIAFVPTHAILYQKTISGSPAFDFVLSDTAGDVSNSGWVSLTQTNAFNGGGEVGFSLYNTSFDTGNTVDNFSVSPTVVPEPGPSAWCALFALGGIGLACRRVAVRRG